MKKFESLDHEDCPTEDQIAIECYPGFLGCESDVIDTTYDALIKLCEIDLSGIEEGCTDTGEQTAMLTSGNQAFPIRYDWATLSFSMLLDQLPSIEVAVDQEYGTYIWFLSEGSTERDMEQQVGVLTNWLRSLLTIN
jgi:hypothetical protein